MTRALGALASAAAMALACGAAPGPAKAPAATPTAAAPASGPRATMPSGALYRLELALTPEDQAQGLMYRESLPANSGMLFIFPTDEPHHFWMKNTMIPLDMIWMDASGKVLFVSADTPPCKADPCPTYGPDGPARQVLEIAGGLAAKEKVTVGSTLKLQDVPR
ncbi:MAG: DUF192 domain-containing protein [Syntrophomonadaceae bacterium]